MKEFKIREEYYNKGFEAGRNSQFPFSTKLGFWNGDMFEDWLRHKEPSDPSEAKLYRAIHSSLEYARKSEREKIIKLIMGDN